MGKGLQGPTDVFLYLEGYDLTAEYVETLSFTEEAETADITGFGTTFRKHAPTGIATVGVELGNAIFNDSTLKTHALFATGPSTGPQGTARILCMGFAQTSIGANCEGFQGAFQTDYRVLAGLDAGVINLCNASYQVTGARDPGVVVYPLSQVTSDANSQSTSIDNGSSTTGDFAAYLQLQQTTAGDGITVTMQHSSDNVAWASLGAFASVSSTTPQAQRITGSEVGRYTANAWAFGQVGGTGDATFYTMLSRASTF